MMILLKSVLIWVCFIPVAILNGGLREYVLTPMFTAQWALPISGILLSVCIFFLTWILLPRIKNLSRGMCYRVGLFWVFLTILFELVCGQVSGIAFPELMAAYNPMTGNLWLLVLITTLLSPAVAFRLSGPDMQDKSEL
ncbi:hypothetical protein [Bacteroides caecicola]|uniref:hypothetical protein n=1 Tax=Bacteroidaceae TaxID=815 RepID=UPI002011EAFB|nr:hypothetical protein [Bacteroides caecicola]MCL1625515.1 hypothetical protein [Bacteroides caecicola]